MSDCSTLPLEGKMFTIYCEAMMLGGLGLNHPGGLHIHIPVHVKSCAANVHDELLKNAADMPQT